MLGGARSAAIGTGHGDNAALRGRICGHTGLAQIVVYRPGNGDLRAFRNEKPGCGVANDTDFGLSSAVFISDREVHNLR